MLRYFQALTFTIFNCTHKRFKIIPTKRIYEILGYFSELKLHIFPANHTIKDIDASEYLKLAKALEQLAHSLIELTKL